MRLKYSFFIFTILIFCCSQPLFAEDKVVAIVNNEIITQKDLNDFLNFIRMQYAQEFKGMALEEKVQAMRLDLLQRLIEDRIMLQEAKAEKFIIEPSRIKARINEIKKRYPSESEFERDLARQGLAQADMENKMREQMLMYNIIEQKVRSKIIVWPDEITGFYNQDKQKFLRPQERSFTVINLESEDVAKTVSYQLRSGKKIEELIGIYPFTTDKLSALEGEQLRKEIEDTVFKLGMGEVSNPVKMEGKYYIFRLDDIIASQQLSLNESQDKIREFLFEKKLQESLAKWLDEIKKRSYIKILEN